MTLITTTLTGLVLATGALTAATAGAAQPAETCFGLAPTIVATDQDRVVGTEGPDVVVATDVGMITTLGGDDTICVTGGRWIDAGDGNDRVSSRVAQRGNMVILGSGSDLFEGSDARDRVRAEAFDGSGPVAGQGAEDTDTVHTYGGKDRVLTGTSSQPNHDIVSLGSGRDTVRLAGGAGASAVVRGGRGADEIEMRGEGEVRIDLHLDRGTVEVDGERRAKAADFEDVQVAAYDGTVHVHGTRGRNLLSVVSRDSRIHAAGGRDRVLVFGCGSVARGGPGADVLVSTDEGCRRDPVRLYGGAGPDVLRGSRAADVLIGNAGWDRAFGNGGKDRCRAERERSCELG